jgi:hypothetical protein
MNLAEQVIGGAIVEGGWGETGFSRESFEEALQFLEEAKREKMPRARKSLRRAKRFLPQDIVEIALSN